MSWGNEYWLNLLFNLVIRYESIRITIWVNIMLHEVNKKALQYYAYHPLASHACFSGYQMSTLRVLKWTNLNRSLVMATRCHWKRGRAGSRKGGSHVWCLGEWGWRGQPYSEVQCIIDHGHVDIPLPTLNRMIDRHDWKHYLPTTSLIVTGKPRMWNKMT